ncbi:MAG: transporter substrate-binding domain-containing protein [Granulosicoccus sp.]|nr:transporter substrate-binding domain-containing protein [Granulosicoccus sp.]
MLIKKRISLFAALVAGAVAMLTTSLSIAADPTIRVGVLKFGTVNWELKSMQHHGLDTENGFDLEIVPFSGGDATRIALLGGEVDVIVSDWLWVSRQRSEGRNYAFSPYSSSVGAIMVPPDTDIQSLADLKGKKIGVAGGPLDKSWLLLQGMATKQHDLDLSAENDIAFGAPPLLAEKAKDGELDAVLNYWHFCARLEAEGFTRLVSAEEAANALGSSGPVAAIGYVFDEGWASDGLAEAFVKASRATKQIMKESDDEWQRLSDSGAIKDSPEALVVLRDRFREGIPSRAHDEEVEDAGIVYGLLSELGGKKLVGNAETMAEGTYWDGAPLP